MKKAIYNCATKQMEIIDMPPEEEAAMVADWEEAKSRPVKKTETEELREQVAALAAKFNALENKQE